MSPTSMVQSFQVLVFILLVTKALSVHSRNYSPQYPCKPPHQNTYIFCNTSLPISTRVQNLINLHTLAEKITRLSDNASSIPRLGIPPYEWWSESLHGIAANGPGVSFSNGPVQSATMFPQVLLTAASFNRTLWYSIARATAVEARAMYNVGQAGLTFWAPNVNIFRDPRWGRGQETPGEDPMVASAFAIEYVKGLQGEDLSAASSGGLMLSACCKHFIGYDLENWMGIERYSFNAVVRPPPSLICLEVMFKNPITALFFFFFFFFFFADHRARCAGHLCAAVSKLHSRRESKLFNVFLQ
ncbi:hypothetical protein Scep_018462 [Stephania cephalantha]|uniref:Glycoside hydrolase family 3 N-terminal domain-containing protein n=1 Tax=Stephania cephalantha TaxID=152367 RepID=A0AAP0I9A6_9MAGN